VSMASPVTSLKVYCRRR